MMSKRKKSCEASGSVVVVLSTAVSHPEQHQRRMMGGVGVRLQTRRELLHQMAPQYRAALPAQKREGSSNFLVKRFHWPEARRKFQKALSFCNRALTSTFLLE
jgi:hypothetical protein